MAEKQFRLTPDEIKPLVTGRGACFATDMITVGGQPVGFMYREKPDNNTDSGWRFLAGSESQEYMDDPENLSLYDVNTIANYDPAVIKLLNAPTGSAFQRTAGSDKFVKVDYSPEE